MQTVLNVAEKPSIAKSLSSHLCENGQPNRIRSHSQYNPVTKFQRQFDNREANVIVTSVTGHICGIDFVEGFNNWQRTDPLVLLQDAAIETKHDPKKSGIKQNLEEQSRAATDIVLWLDCDREGEAIAYEVLEICQVVNPR